MTSRPRTGNFIEYDGKDCGLFGSGSKLYVERLDKTALANGFVEAFDGHFQKRVSDSDLVGEPFSIRPYVIYRGTEFAVMKVYDSKDVLTIVATDKKIADKFKLVLIDRDLYALNIPFSEIQGYREERETVDRWWMPASGGPPVGSDPIPEAPARPGPSGRE